MQKIEEFWYCVSPQREMPLFQQIDGEMDGLLIFLNQFRSKYEQSRLLNPALSPEETLLSVCSDYIIEEPGCISVLRQLVGISDKRLYLDLTYIFNRALKPNGDHLLGESWSSLKKHSTAYFKNCIRRGPIKEQSRDIVLDYLVNNGLVPFLMNLISIPENVIQNIYSYLIAPKERQQKEAKYRGHSCEMYLARFLRLLEVSFLPATKDTELMGERDIKVDLSTMQIVQTNDNDNVHSFDLIVLDGLGNIKVLIQSLLHTSDPGQYGVDKSNETLIIKEKIINYNRSNAGREIELWGFVDGVGFSENPVNTIGKMIDKFDEFIQVKSLFKLAIALKRLGLLTDWLGIRLDDNYFDDEIKTHFRERFFVPSGAVLVLDDALTGTKINCRAGLSDVLVGA